MRRLRSSRRALGWALPLAIGLVLAPGTASASVYCVAPATGCADQTFPDVQQALDAARANGGPDEVRLGATTYATTSGLGYADNGSSANSLTLSGAGRTATTLTRTTNGPILVIGGGGNARNTIGDLRFHIVTGGGMPSDGLLGGSADVFRVDVDADPGVGNSEGIQVINGSAHDVRISMAASGGTLGFVGGGAGPADGLFDSTIRADKGAVMYAGAVRDVQVEAGQAGIQLQNGTVDDVSIRLHGSGAFGGIGLFAGSDIATMGGTLTARHVTVVGDGQTRSTGLFVSTAGAFGAITQTLDVRNAIVRGVATSFQRFGTTSPGTSPANLTILYSDYDPGTATQSGPGSGPDLTDPRNVNVDPRFVNAAGGDLRLRGGSPAIDAGNPAGLSAGEPLVNVLGAARLVDGNGDGIARQDMGAFEYQRRAPVLTSPVAGAASAKAGTAVTFAASVSDPDGDDVALAWRFDDGATAAGASVAHAFATPGTHVATVTATDSAGLTASGQVSVAIAGGAIADGPIITRLSLAPRAFRPAGSGPSASAAARRRAARAPATGTTVDFTLGAAGSVRFSVERASGGRKVRGRCVAPRRANRRARRCVRYTAMRGSFVRSGGAGSNRLHFSGRIGGKALSPGRYRLVGSAGGSMRAAVFAIRRPPSRRAR